MGKLDTAANVALITVSLAVSAEIGYRAFSGRSRGAGAAESRSAGGGTPTRNANQYRIGDKIGPVDGINFASSKRTLLFVVRSGCHYCRESTAFYRRIVETVRGMSQGVRLTAACGEGVDACSAFLKADGVLLDDVVTVNVGALRVAGTPTLLLVDSSGAVLSVWTGRLRPDVEDQVLRAVNGGV